jgi:hypothetical protein
MLMNGVKKMEFLSHWHCIVPVIVIAVAMFLLSLGKKDKK